MQLAIASAVIALALTSSLAADRSVPEASTGFPIYHPVKVGAVVLYCPDGRDIPLNVMRVRDVRIVQTARPGYKAGDKYAVVQPLRGGATQEVPLSVLVGDIGEKMSKVPAVGRVGRLIDTDRIVRVDAHFGYRYGSLVTDLGDGAVHMVKTDLLRKVDLKHTPKPPVRNELFSGLVNLRQIKPYGLINVGLPLSETERAQLAAHLFEEEARKQADEQ